MISQDIGRGLDRHVCGANKTVRLISLDGTSRPIGAGRLDADWQVHSREMYVVPLKRIVAVLSYGKSSEARRTERDLQVKLEPLVISILLKVIPWTRLAQYTISRSMHSVLFWTWAQATRRVWART